MLDELFDLFDRKQQDGRTRQGGLRGFVGRLTGDGDDRDDYRNRRRTDQSSRRDYDEYDDERYRRDHSRRRSNDDFDFD